LPPPPAPSRLAASNKGKRRCASYTTTTARPPRLADAPFVAEFTVVQRGRADDPPGERRRGAARVRELAPLSGSRGDRPPRWRHPPAAGARRRPRRGRRAPWRAAADVLEGASTSPTGRQTSSRISARRSRRCACARPRRRRHPRPRRPGLPSRRRRAMPRGKAPPPSGGTTRAAFSASVLEAGYQTYTQEQREPVIIFNSGITN
jgi:hypothetical protein